MHYSVKPKLSQHANIPATVILVSVLLVWGTEITRYIGPSPDVLVWEADHASSLEIVRPGHLAACLALYGLYCACMPSA